jgi:hypothetical protein
METEVQGVRLVPLYDDSPSFLKMVLQKTHLLLKTPFLNFSGSLSAGRLPPT